jgi:hypothetical protein
MNPRNGFSQHREALERAARVIDALQRKDFKAIGNELTHEVLLEGIASAEAVYGMGLDFTVGDIYVRVDGSPVSLPKDCVGCHVAALGCLLNAYCENRVVAITVRPENYKLTGTT